MPDAASNPDSRPTAGPEPVPRAKRTLRRRLIWTTAIVLALVLLAPLALALGPVRGMVADRIGSAVGREVEIGSGFAFWGHGIDLDEIVIRSPDGFDGPLATVKHVHVSLDVFALLGGRLDAEVTVEAPHVTFRRDAAGRGNADGILDELAGDDAEEKDAASGRAHLKLVVRDGRIEAPAIAAGPAGRIENLRATVVLGPGGRKADVECVAKQAQVGGQDAVLVARFDTDGSGTGPVEVLTPALDLARLTSLVEGATGVRGIQGSLRVALKGMLRDGEAFDGTIEVDGAQIRALTPDDVTVSLQTASLRMTAQTGAGGNRGTLAARLANVAVESSPRDGARRFEEPAITLDATGLYDATKQKLRVDSAMLEAGRSATLEITKENAFAIQMVAPRSAEGEVTLRSDLARLSELRSLVPALESIRGGSLGARLRANPPPATGESGIDLSAAIRIENLVLNVDQGEAYRDPDLIVTGRYVETPGRPSRVDVYRVTSAVLRTTGASTSNPFVAYLGDDGMSFGGPLDVVIDLDALSRLNPSVLGLESGERVRGTLALTGTADGDGTRMNLDARLAGRGLGPPVRPGARVPPPSDVNARIKINRHPGDVRVLVSDLDGLGLGKESQLTARLESAGDSMRLADATARVVLDLARARSWLEGPLELAPGERLAGLLSADVVASSQRDGLRVKGTTRVTDLTYQRSAADPVWREPSVVAQHDVWLPDTAGRSQADTLTLAMGGLTADLSGSSMTQRTARLGEVTTDVDLKGTLRGDATSLAPTLRALFGADYADLTGAGRIDGSLVLRGPTQDGLRGVVTDATVALGSWKTGGMVLDGVRIVARKPSANGALLGELTTKLNGGAVRLGARLTPGSERTPWDATISAERVDTSGLLVSQGPGRFLAFVLPSLVPADADTAVLSGLLDARVELASADTADPVLMNALTGKGEVHMTQGSIKDSTLFRAAGKKGALGQVGQVLAAAVPELGRAVKALSEAMTFSTLDSEFRIGQRRIQVDRAALAGTQVQIALSGLVDFEQNLDLKARVKIGGGTGEKLAKYLPNGTIPLRVRGTAERTVVTPDLSVKDLIGNPLDLIKNKDVIKGLKDLLDR